MSDSRSADFAQARLATADEITTTARFTEDSHQEIADARGGHWLIEHDLPRDPPAELHAFAVSADDQCLVVGLIDNAVVGHARAFVTRARAAELCMIEELYVGPQARAVGVGSAMLAFVQAWAVEQGCVAIESHVLPGNRSGKNFFERVGMKTRKMRVSAELPNS